MVQFGTVWYGMVRYGTVWYGNASSIERYGMVWYGMAWHGIALQCMAWYGMVCMVWYGMEFVAVVGNVIGTRPLNMSRVCTRRGLSGVFEI